MTTATLDRQLVERLVRDAVKRRWAGPRAEMPVLPNGAPRLVVNISARHCHVTQEDLERLFGKGHQLTPHKALYQDGFFAAEEMVTIIGPRHRMIPNLRILGPCRDHSQVELAFTDAILWREKWRPAEVARQKLLRDGIGKLAVPRGPRFEAGSSLRHRRRQRL